MTTSLSRQVRSARNAIVEALGIGETYPLRDLPVSAEPPVAAFGTVARIGIDDSERSVVYRLLDQDAQPLPGGALPEATGIGARIAIDTPAISDDITFTVEARRPNGRTAILFGTAQVRVGLDNSLAVAVVPAGPLPVVIDYGATVDVEIANSQEGVTYHLVGRPDPDPATPDDAKAMATDIALSGPSGVPGTGNAIRVTSIPLEDDTAIFVRASKVFGADKPTQATLLKARLSIFVRPDPGLGVAATPPIVDHDGQSIIKIGAAAAGVSYTLHGRKIADAEFSRADAVDPGTLAVSTPDGDLHVVTPPTTIAWEEPPGFKPLGQPVAGTGGDLSLPASELNSDTIIVVEARKEHGEGPDSFTSAERLDQPAAVLVRPDPNPPLRLVAFVADGKITGLQALSGEEGVFYSLAAGDPLGDLYLHQHDPENAALNKGVGALALMVDFVVSGGTGLEATSSAPPPLPSLDFEPVKLPVKIAVKAKRAMTGLTTDLGKVSIEGLPVTEAQPPTVVAGKSAKIVIAQPVSKERYAILVDGRRIADPVSGAGPLSLDTGPLLSGSEVELWSSSSAEDDAVQVERVTPLRIAIG